MLSKSFHLHQFFIRSLHQNLGRRVNLKHQREKRRLVRIPTEVAVTIAPIKMAAVTVSLNDMTTSMEIMLSIVQLVPGLWIHTVTAATATVPPKTTGDTAVPTLTRTAKRDSGTLVGSMHPAVITTASRTTDAWSPPSRATSSNPTPGTRKGPGREAALAALRPAAAMAPSQGAGTKGIAGKLAQQLRCTVIAEANQQAIRYVTTPTATRAVTQRGKAAAAGTTTGA